MRIYLTQRSAKKDNALKGTGKAVSPDLVYMATPTQRFMRRCKQLGVPWAIFSDYYQMLKGHGHLRDIDKERRMEAEVTRILREQFSFRFVVFAGQPERMGSEGLEARLIGTIAHCGSCRPSSDWLGRYSPVEKVRQSGLRLVQHLGSESLADRDITRILVAIENTRGWLRSQNWTAQG